MITRTKLSVTMLVSVVCLGFAGPVNGMNWTGKEKIRYMLDEDKKVIGCRSDGIPLPDTLENLVGKKIMEVTGVSGLLENEKELLQATFLSARTSGKAALVKLVVYGGALEQTFKVTPYSQTNDRTAFVLRMSLLRLGAAPQEQCINAGLDQLARQSPPSGQKQNSEDKKPLSERLHPAFMALLPDDSESE